MQLLYIDEHEIANPLGTSRKVYKDFLFREPKCCGFLQSFRAEYACKFFMATSEQFQTTEVREKDFVQRTKVLWRFASGPPYEAPQNMIFCVIEKQRVRKLSTDETTGIGRWLQLAIQRSRL